MVFKKKEASTQTTNKDIKEDTKKPRTKKKAKHPFLKYIALMQKRSDSKVRISTKAAITMEGMLIDLLSSFSDIIGELNRKNKKQTMTVSDVKAAIKLKCEDGELAKHCIMEGSKAVMKYTKK